MGTQYQLARVEVTLLEGREEISVVGKIPAASVFRVLCVLDEIERQLLTTSGALLSFVSGGGAGEPCEDLLAQAANGPE